LKKPEGGEVNCLGVMPSRNFNRFTNQAREAVYLKIVWFHRGGFYAGGSGCHWILVDFPGDAIGLIVFQKSMLVLKSGISW